MRMKVVKMQQEHWRAEVVQKDGGWNCGMWVNEWSQVDQVVCADGEASHERELNYGNME